MEKSALIFIPDISGFTKFVTQTEIQHSNHIITELIELIIDSNQMNMAVSEIEGDAVLFYKISEAPSTSEIYEQSKKMFINFHTHLKIIERDNVCQCGACTTASSLTLKFIAHYGNLSEVRVKSFNKIMGSDVILAHRLLKNKIEVEEYLLLTENLISDIGDIQTNEQWVELFEYRESIENFDEVVSTYIPFTQLINSVPDVSGKPYETQGIVVGEISIIINAPLLVVHKTLTDHSKKMALIPNIKEVREDSKINRVNASHTCVFDDLEIHFVTRQNKINKNEISYIEEGQASFGFEFINDFKLTGNNDSTELSCRLILPPLNRQLNFFKRIYEILKRKFIVFNSIRGQKKGLEQYKKYAEQEAAKH